MSSKKNNRKKGATGKQYTTYGDRIKVTYTDGSTRVVRPSDASYNATKKAMESDIANRKLIGNKKSNTTASTALGAGKKDTSLIASATVNDKAKEATQKRKAANAAVQNATANKDITPKLKKATTNTEKTNNNLIDAVKYGAQTGANTAVSGIKTGLLGAGRTVADVVGADDLESDLSYQLRLASAKQQLEQQKINSKYNTNFGGAAKVVSDVTAGGVGMLPTVGSFVLLPSGKIAAAGKAVQLGAKALGYAPLALQAYGGGINQALNEGATVNQANRYGLGYMAKELGTEVMFGGITHVPGFKNLGDVAANMVKGETAKKVAGAAGKMAGEGIEEAAAEIADPFLQRATYNEDAENSSAKDVAYSALVGALTAGALNAGIKGVESGVNLVNTARQPKDITPKLVKAGQNTQKNAQAAQNGAQHQVNVEDENTRQRMLEEQEKILKEKRVLEKRKNQLEQAEREKLDNEIRALESNINLLKNGRSTAFDNALYSAMDEYTAPQKNNGNQTIPMEERTLDNVSDRKIKAYQQEHPEVKSYYREQAEIMLNDLNNMIDGGREYGFDPETRNVKTVRYQTRTTSSQIERLLQAGMTKDQIRDGLHRIIRDSGAENTANAKKVEIAVNDSLTQGYQSLSGNVPKNLDFVYRNKSLEAMKRSYNNLNSEKSFASSNDPAGLIEELKYLDNRIGEEQNIMDAYGALLPEMSVYETMTEEQLREEMIKLESASLYAPDAMAEEMMNRYAYLDKLAEGRVNEYLENQAREERISSLQDQLKAKKLEPAGIAEMREIQKKLREIEAKQAGISIFNKQNIAQKQAQQQNQQQEPTISENETASDSYEDYDVSQLPKDVFDFYNQVGEVGGKAHFNIRFVQNLEHDAEGKSDGHGNILISAERANNIETLRRVVAHECYHAMKNTDQWRDIQDLAYKLYKLENPNGTKEQMLQAKIDQYYKRSGGKVQLDEEGAWDEVGAELMGEILSDPKMADRIWNQNPTLAQRIMRWLEDMVQKLHDFVFEVEAEDSIYKQAFEAYSEGLRSMRWQGGAQSESRYSIDSNLKAQFDNWMQGHMNENDYFYLGDTPKSLTRFGAKTLPLVMTQDVLAKVTGKKHSIALEELSKLPDQIANPVMLFKGSAPNSFVVLTEMQDKSGKEVITAIHLKRYQNRMQVNRIASVYGKDNIMGYVNGNLKAGNLLDVDTKKAPTWFTSRGLQLPKLVQTIIDAKNNIPQNQQEGNDQTDIRYSMDNPQQENIDRYGAIPPGENPYGNNRDIQVPQQTEDDNRVGRFNRTAAEAQQTDDQTVDILMRELRTYKPSSNQKQMNYANNVIGSVGWERAADSFQTDFRAGKRMTANDVAIGERCIQEAQKAGDYQKASELIGDVASLGVELGQAVQAMSMLKRLTPEGRLMALKRVQQRINSDLQQKSKKKKNKNDITPELKRAGESSGQAQQNAIQQDLGFKPVTISPETEQRILEARGPKAMDEAWDAAVQEMADQVPATLMDKVRAWRYLSMLSNLRTHIRNLVSNGVKRGVIGIEHQIQAGLEAAFVKDGGERYRTFKKVPKEYKEFAEWDFETNIRRQMEQTGSRYNDAAGQINRNKRIFKPNILETGRKSNENALAGVDMVFKKEAYINAFANYMLANNLSPSVLQSNANATSTYEAAQVYAMQKAYEATFQEANTLANFLSQLEHSSKVGEVIIGALMPFKKTPLNILKQGTMVYSPIGLVRGISNAMTKVRTGEMTQVEAIEQISRGLTGTGIAAVGALMMSLGMIALGGDDDKRKAAYDRQMGDQNYALKFSDGSTYSIDWLSPSVMPLLMGAEIYDTIKRASNGELTDQSIMSAVTSSLMRIGDPLLEMSCMSGFADALSSYSEGGTEALSNIIGTSIKNYAGQFIPAPLGALARTIDDTVRSSYASKDSSIGKGAEQFLRQQRSKIPMVSMQNEASFDVWGNERKREGAGDGIENVAFRAFNNFVNPGNYSSNKRTSLDNELERLYQSTGDSGIFPAVASGTINESKQNPKISMTPLEFSKFSTTKGRKSQQYVSDFVNSEAYDQLDDSEKADIISSLYDLANYEARKQTLRNRGYDYSQENYENVLTEITENKITPAEYYSQKSLVGDSITGTYSEVKRQMKICDKMGMDYEAYHTASTYLNKLRNSTDENGKTIKGNAAKDKKFAALKKWVEEGDVTEEQAWYLWTEEYNSNNRKNDDGYMHWRDCPYQWIIDNKEYEKAMEAEKRKNVE